MLINLLCSHCDISFDKPDRQYRHYQKKGQTRFYCSRTCRAQAYSRRCQESFDIWKFIDKRGPDECWPWQHRTNKDGYGIVTYKFRTVGAHRVVFLITHGLEDLAGVVMHTCDFPPCCNPRHLKAGSRQDNSDDCMAKNRIYSKLKEDQVLIIIERLMNGDSPTAIARDFAVKKSSIFAIKKQTVWKRVWAKVLL